MIVYVKENGLHALYNRGVTISFDEVLLDEFIATLKCYGEHKAIVCDPSLPEFISKLKNFDVEVVIP